MYDTVQVQREKCALFTKYAFYSPLNTGNKAHFLCDCNTTQADSGMTTISLTEKAVRNTTCTVAYT